MVSTCCMGWDMGVTPCAHHVLKNFPSQALALPSFPVHHSGLTPQICSSVHLSGHCLQEGAEGTGAAGLCDLGVTGLAGTVEAGCGQHCQLGVPQPQMGRAGGK